MKKTGLVLAGAITASLGAMAWADGHATERQLSNAVKARQAQMVLYSFNLSTLGAMAQGEMEYDAAVAQTAADNLAALTSLSQAGYWLPGTDSESFEGSRALPAIWEEGSMAGQIGADLAAAAAAMQAAAGTDLESLRGAMGAVGGACGACHDDYRQPRG